jgi:hypothetical protein
LLYKRKGKLDTYRWRKFKKLSFGFDCEKGGVLGEGGYGGA